jgi:hypothetical protein
MAGWCIEACLGGVTGWAIGAAGDPRKPIRDCPLLDRCRRAWCRRRRARYPRTALKFYTEEGNWDIVGNNTPVFFFRDPLRFSDLNHAIKRDPRTGMRTRPSP